MVLTRKGAGGQAVTTINLRNVAFISGRAPRRVIVVYRGKQLAQIWVKR